MEKPNLTLSHRSAKGLVTTTKVPIYLIDGQEVTQDKWLKHATPEQKNQLNLFIKTLNT